MKIFAISFLFATAFGANMAHANCGPLIEALEKAQKQERLAQYSLDSREQPLPGNPMVVRIGKFEYMSLEIGGRHSHYERHESGGGNPILSALKRAAKDGTARCEGTASETLRGIATARIRFDNPAAPKSMNPTTMWIDKRNGLPAYHEINGLDGGFAWVYGDAVKEPSVKK